MKLIRFFLFAIAITVLLAVVTGCASPKEVTNARIRVVAGTNEVLTIDRPKDTTIARAEYRRPDGSVIVIEGYQSTANAAAVAAVDAIESSAVRYGGFVTWEMPICGDLTLPIDTITQPPPATATVGTLTVQ